MFHRLSPLEKKEVLKHAEERAMACPAECYRAHPAAQMVQAVQSAPERDWAIPAPAFCWALFQAQAWACQGSLVCRCVYVIGFPFCSGCAVQLSVVVNLVKDGKITLNISLPPLLPFVKSHLCLLSALGSAQRTFVQTQKS